MVEKPVASGTFMAFFIKKAPAVQTVLKMIQEKGKDYGKAPHNGLRDPKDPSKGSKKIVRESTQTRVLETNRH
jgi:arginyl-tRNA synthetase